MSIREVPRDIIKWIAANPMLSVADIDAISRADKFLQGVVHNPMFWETLVRARYPPSFLESFNRFGNYDWKWVAIILELLPKGGGTFVRTSDGATLKFEDQGDQYVLFTVNPVFYTEFQILLNEEEYDIDVQKELGYPYLFRVTHEDYHWKDGILGDWQGSFFYKLFRLGFQLQDSRTDRLISAPAPCQHCGEPEPKFVCVECKETFCVQCGE